MNRIRITGLCVPVTIALACALAASSAHAASYKRCVAEKHGEYANSNCTSRSVKPGKGGFELAPVEACVAQRKGKYSESKCETLDERKGKPRGSFELTSGRRFTATSASAVIVGSGHASGNVECSASSTTGEITGPKTAVERTTFSGCEFLGIPCQSAGPDGTPSNKFGVVITNLLDSRLLGHGEQAGGAEHEEPGTGEAWDELLSAEHQPYQFELECRREGEAKGAVFARVMGSVSAKIEPVNKAGTTSTRRFADLNSGEQGLLYEASESGFGGPWAGPDRNIEEMTATVKYEQAIDIATE